MVFHLHMRTKTPLLFVRTNGMAYKTITTYSSDRRRNIGEKGRGKSGKCVFFYGLQIVSYVPSRFLCNVNKDHPNRQMYYLSSTKLLFPFTLFYANLYTFSGKPAALSGKTVNTKRLYRRVMFHTSLNRWNIWAKRFYKKIHTGVGCY